MSEPQETPVAVARTLAERMEGLTAELARVIAYGHRSRIMIVITAVSLVLDVALTVVVAIGLLQGHHTQVSVTELHSNNIAACHISNATRADEVHLWDYLYSLARQTGPPPDAATQKADNELLAYIRHAFAPLNCQKLYRLP